MPIVQPAPPPVAVECRAEQLRAAVDGRDGDFNGMSHAGTELSLRNLGPDCMLPALPRVTFRDARGRTLPAVRRAPVGMHPGPVMMPVRIAAGHRAVTGLRWVSGPVFPHSRALRATAISVAIGGGQVAVPVTATLFGAAGAPAGFDQPPLTAREGMAAD